MRCFMSVFTPPYTKTHVLVLGGLALTAGLILLFLFNLPKDTQSPATKIETISADQARDKFKEPLEKIQQNNPARAWAEDKLVILDIRNHEAYTQRHITGAMNAPLEHLEASSFTTDYEMIVYGETEEDAEKAAAILQQKGVPGVYLLTGTLDEMETHGYAITAGGNAQ